MAEEAGQLQGCGRGWTLRPRPSRRGCACAAVLCLPSHRKPALGPGSVRAHVVSGMPASRASAPRPWQAGWQAGVSRCPATPPHHALSQRTPAGRCTRTEPAHRPREGLCGRCPGSGRSRAPAIFPKGLSCFLLPLLRGGGVQMLRVLKADSQGELELHSQLEPGSKECTWGEV